MQLINIQNVCKKLNDSAPYALLFESSHENTELNVKKFIENFAEQNNLETSSITPSLWSFSHKAHGQLNDGVVEVDFESTPPKFDYTDVSEAKITDNSPDLDDAISAAKKKINDVKLEYIASLKSLLNHMRTSSENLPQTADCTDNKVTESPDASEEYMEYDLDSELKDLQKNYHIAMDRLQEIQNFTGNNYESLKARVEMSLTMLEQSIKDAQARVGKSS